MTREENIAKLAELFTQTDSLVKDYNEAIQSGGFEAASKADTAMTALINEYTSIARGIIFDECRESEDPMMHAIKTLSYGTIAVKDKKEGEDKIPVREIVQKEKPIDLAKLHDYCGGIGASKDWSHICQQMNFLLTAQKCVDLGISPKAVHDSYAMSEISRNIDMGKTPTSKTNMLKTLQKAVSAMVGEEYKATSHDVNFLLSVYSKKGRKALSVSCANHRNFRNYLAEVCHRIVMEKAYEVEFKAVKA